MKKLVVIAMAVLLCAGFASAQSAKEDAHSPDLVTANGTGSAPDGIPDWFLNIDVTGTESWDGPDSPNNEVLVRMIGAGAVVTGAGVDATITTSDNGSWLSEAAVAFSQNPDSWFIRITPCAAFPNPGSESCSTGGIIDFSDNALPNIDIVNGELKIEFHESFDDVADDIDATWDSGTVTIAIMGGVPVPTISTVAMIALALMLIGMGTFMLKRRFNQA